MSNRRIRSKGQAIVLVTLALVAMAGMLGLSVDLGWMFFIKKQAQTAADAAALAVVNEAIARNGGTQSVTCGTNGISCLTNQDCSSVDQSTNVYNGCQYAQRNGFKLTSPSKVLISTGTGLPPTVAGLSATSVVYWATARAVQTVPQLFSAVLGNTTGVVSAIATAGIVGVIQPGSFIAMDQAGDCMTDPISGAELCGVDVNVTGAGNKGCPGTALIGTLCASSGIVLDSPCNGTTQAGCGTTATGTGKNFAGETKGGAQVAGPFTGIQGTCPGSGCTLDSPGAWPATQLGSTTDDPTKNIPQPPIATTKPVMPCGILQGTTLTNVTLGPFNYYVYTGLQNGSPVIAPGKNAIPVTVGNGVKFAADGGCPGLVLPGESNFSNAQAGSGFPSYMFWGGLNIAGNVTFGPGEYVGIGTATDTGSTLSYTTSASSVTGDSSAGTLFLTTAPGYPGLDTQVNAFGADIGLSAGVNKFQGSIDIKTGNSSSVDLTGVDLNNLPSDASQFIPYNGYLVWQDRRNSGSDLYNQSPQYDSESSCATTCTGSDDGTIVGTVATNTYTAAEQQANGVTASSPGFIYAAATPLSLKGTIYMPRGSWLNFQGGPDVNAALKIITGAIWMTGGGQVVLLPTSNPTIKFVTALIQ